MGLPTLLLAMQLGVGLMAAGDLALSLARRRIGWSTLGQALMAVLLIGLGMDGLFLGLDLVGQVVYRLDVEPSWARPGLIGLIVAGAVLWSLDR